MEIGIHKELTGDATHSSWATEKLCSKSSSVTALLTFAKACAMSARRAPPGHLSVIWQHGKHYTESPFEATFRTKSAKINAKWSADAQADANETDKSAGIPWLKLGFRSHRYIFMRGPTAAGMQHSTKSMEIVRPSNKRLPCHCAAA